jgi:hypothetical protein
MAVHEKMKPNAIPNTPRDTKAKPFASGEPRK